MYGRSGAMPLETWCLELWRAQDICRVEVEFDVKREVKSLDETFSVKPVAFCSQFCSNDSKRKFRALCAQNYRVFRTTTCKHGTHNEQQLEVPFHLKTRAEPRTLSEETTHAVYVRHYRACRADCPSALTVGSHSAPRL